MVMTEVVRGGGGGAGFLPDGGNWMGTMVDVIVGVTGEVMIPTLLLMAIGMTGDDKLRLNGRAIEVLPVADIPCLPSLAACWSSSLWLVSCVSLGVSSGGGGLELLADVGAGNETDAGDVKLSGSGRADDDKLLGRATDPPDDKEPVFECWFSLGCERLIIRAHVATFMFI